jgi:hypothetical protein
MSTTNYIDNLTQLHVHLQKQPNIVTTTTDHLREGDIIYYTNPQTNKAYISIFLNKTYNDDGDEQITIKTWYDTRDNDNATENNQQINIKDITDLLRLSPYGAIYLNYGRDFVLGNLLAKIINPNLQIIREYKQQPGSNLYLKKNKTRKGATTGFILQYDDFKEKETAYRVINPQPGR